MPSEPIVIDPPAVGPLPLYPIRSVDNALRLVMLMSQRSRLRTTDTSRLLGVAPSTAHRLLAMLQYRGFVEYDAATRNYVPGPALNNMVFAALRGMDVRAVVHPILVRLNNALTETVHLGQLEGGQVRFIDAIESPRATRVASRLGVSMPAHCTSTGKALLAMLSADDLHRLYPDEELEQMTPRSLGRRADLERELARIRRVGYAMNGEESEEGVSSVAVAVRSATVGVHVAINVAVPTSRASATDLRRIAAVLLEAAAVIGSGL
jgi:DNA-binding IclR family transcriptional regulator